MTFKKLITLACPALVFLAGCDKNEEEKTETYARFAQTEIRVSATTTGLSLKVEWSRTKWELSSESEFITGFTLATGGNETLASGSTDAGVKLTANTTTEERRGKVTVTNLTTGEKKQTTIIQAAATVEEPKPTPKTSVGIYPATTYQHVVGFGGMYNPKIWLGGNLINSDDMDLMYNPDRLGYTILRLMVYPNESDWAADVEGARLAQQHGAVIFASPWDCTNALADQLDGKKHLKVENYQAYADHLINYINYMKDNGVNLYAISVQNEPDMDFTYWRPAEVANFVRDYGAQIRATGVKLMAPEACGTSPEYTDPILNDEGAYANTDIVAGHLYQGFIDHSSGYVRGRHAYISGLYNSILAPTGKTWWMTEHLFNDGERETDPSKWEFRKWKYEMEHLGKELHMSMEGYCSAYIYWYLKRFYGMIADNDTRSQTQPGNVLGNGYILSHYAKYASDMTRIRVVTDDANVLATAYINGDGSEMTAVLLNMKSAPVNTEISSPSSIESVSAVESTETYKMRSIEAGVEDDGKTVSVELAAGGIVSVRLLLK